MPKGIELHQELIMVLGEDSAHKFLEHWQGTNLYIPTIQFFVRFKRNERIRMKWLQGEHNIRALAQEFNVSIQTVYVCTRDLRRGN